MTKVLVIGYGSAGIRHSRILRDTGCEVAILISQNISDCPKVEKALSVFVPGYVVVANRTSEHVRCLRNIGSC